MFLHANSNNVCTHHYTSKHTHCCSGLALYNGIRDHHLPLLSRHFILPLLVHCLSITLIVTAPFLFHICFLMVLMWWHLSLTFLTICASYQSLNSCHIIPARSDSVKDLSLSILFLPLRNFPIYSPRTHAPMPLLYHSNHLIRGFLPLAL